MTRTNPTIPEFHEDLPDCSQAWPTGMQTSWCPTECDIHCRDACEGAWNPTQCVTKCEKKCMDSCLFVPCCTRESICEDGTNYVRESCRFDYGGGIQISRWVNAGPCRP